MATRTPRTRAKRATTSIVLGPNSYGKSRVRILKVSRAGRRHTIQELNVDISLEGDFEAVHTTGDNRHCLPTDTMKNTVYALGKNHPIDTIESFAVHLAQHFVSRNPQVSRAKVSIAQTPWDRVALAGRPHPHCFTKAGEERQTCSVTLDRNAAQVSSGLTGLLILKTTDSAFRGYPTDEYTTLPETRDRIMATSVTATWHFAGSARGSPERKLGSGGPLKDLNPPARTRVLGAVAGLESDTLGHIQRAANTDFGRIRKTIRESLVTTFANHKSESVQQTLYAMGKAALKASPAIAQITLSLPNKHCLLINLTPFGLKNPNEIFVPTDEPHGLIEATLERR